MPVFSLLLHGALLIITALLPCAYGYGEVQITVGPRFETYMYRQDDNQRVGGAVQGSWKWQQSFHEEEQLKIELTTLMGNIQHQQALDIRELSWDMSYKSWEIHSGLRQVFWGVTESRHLVDVINQTDLRVDPDGDVRLSQAMASLSYNELNQSITLFALPCYRPRPNAAILNTPLVGYSEKTFVPLRCDRLDRALRTSLVYGLTDIGLGYFDGNSREPYAGHSADEVKNAYPRVTRYSLDLQWTSGAWLLKAEGLLQRSPYGLDKALVSGVEYSLKTSGYGPSEYFFLYEHLEDDRCNSIPLACGDMIALRWLANDPQNTSLLFSLVQERATSNTGFRLSLSRRLSDNLSLNVKSGELSGTFHALFKLDYGF